MSLLEKKDLNNGIWKIIDNLKDDPLNMKLKGIKMFMQFHNYFPH